MGAKLTWRTCATAVALACAALSLAGCTGTNSQPVSSDASSRSTASPSPSAGSETSVTVTPVIVVAGVDVDGKHVTASGYVAGVIESGKTCTFVFTGPGNTVRVDHAGTADRLTTSCGTVSPPIGSFSRGSWTVKLQYPSSDGTLSSTPVSLEVP